MNLQSRIKAFTKLGEYLKNEIYNDIVEDLRIAEIHNPWFTNSNIIFALESWHEQLKEDMLIAWLSPYKIKEVKSKKRILLVMAGNIPLVGFHDFLTVLVLGHKVVIKMSSVDNVLLKFIIKKLIIIEPEFANSIFFVDEVKDNKYDGVIATGSDNSSRYFEYYFKDAKKIIRKNRRSVAILDGDESEAELKGLADDVFLYFGLGCRSVSKIFLPNGYNIDKLFNAFYFFNKIIEHTKYANNYDYHKAVFLMGSHKLLDNGFLLMKEDTSLFSPVAMLYYEFYDDIHTMEEFIKKNNDKLQCVVSKLRVPFGAAQKPNLWDYADGIDTIEFLRGL